MRYSAVIRILYRKVCECNINLETMLSIENLLDGIDRMPYMSQVSSYLLRIDDVRQRERETEGV